jgi:hypothetical protein
MQTGEAKLGGMAAALEYTLGIHDGGWFVGDVTAEKQERAPLAVAVLLTRSSHGSPARLL